MSFFGRKHIWYKSLIIPVLFVSLMLPVYWLFPQELLKEVNSPVKPTSFYELIRSGELADLQEASRERGLPTEGDSAVLKKRLIDHERDRQWLPFEERIKVVSGDLVILKNADFIQYQEDENGDERILLYGSVDVMYEEKRISADEVTINGSRGLITGRGNVRFSDRGRLYRGDSFFYNVQTDEGYFYNATTSIGHFTYTGGTIRKIGEGNKMEAGDVSVTTCDITNPHYRMEAEELFLYESERVLVKDAYFIYGQDEVLYLPYFYRNLREKALRSSLHFRERSGLVLQNTYTPVKRDEKELVLKGDFYERLGFYTGVDWRLLYERGRTDVRLSGALSNDVFYYDEVTENWSPLGPPGSDPLTIQRSFRYRAGGYQQFIFGERFRNTSELNILLVSDPYYEYDFERRTVGFDLFDLIGQPESDFPRKGSGYSWYLNSYLQGDTLAVSVKNRVQFEPQRNVGVEFSSLPDYYEYRLYSITAPQVLVSHGRMILSDLDSPLFSDISYSSYASYAHVLYYDENADLSSELHRADTALRFTRGYDIGGLLRITPAIEAGAQGQHHVEPGSGELADDRLNSFAYGRTSTALKAGEENAYVQVKHDLKYKLLGPRDLYEFNRFRVHSIGLRGFLQLGHFTDELETSYDLRPAYDWTAGRYEPYIVDSSHFDPLRNTLTFSPAKQLSMKDVIVYNIALSRFETNRFSLLYNSEEIALGDRSVNLMLELSWHHNFQNPLVDSMQSIFRLSAELHRFWSTYFRVYSRNDAVWRYLPETAREYGERPVNPVVDLLKSFNFFNTEDRKASQFKLKSISFGFIHDLHDWELNFDYTGNRELSYDGSRYVWDNTYSMSIRLKDVKDFDIHTRLQEKR